jgi:hypothetical protein
VRVGSGGWWWDGGAIAIAGSFGSGLAEVLAQAWKFRVRVSRRSRELISLRMRIRVV